jgi:hypothetical protein
LYSSPNIIRHIKPTRMRWAGHVARMGKERKCTGFWRESPKERVHSVDRNVDGRVESKRSLGDWPRASEVDSIGSG